MFTVKRALASCFIFLRLLAPAFAQDEQPIRTDLSQLPGYLRLKTAVPNFSTQDAEIAMGQIKKWLKENQKDFPVDCTFRVRSPLQHPFELGESRARVEASLRKLNQGYVGFEQYGEWVEYPKDAKGFSPPSDPEWKRFETEILPSLAGSFERAYQGSVPAALNRLELNGFQSVCNEIKEYLQRRFKANPASINCHRHEQFVQVLANVRAGIDESSYRGTLVTTELYSASFYKLSHPHADGLSYSQITIEGCVFEKPKPIVEKKLEEPKAEVYRPGGKTETVSRKSQKQEERDARRKEKRELDAWLKTQKEDEKKRAQEAREQEKRNELLVEDRRLKEYFPSQSASDPEVQPHHELGESLKSGYKKQHRVAWRKQPEFDADERKLVTLQAKVSKAEEQWIADFNKRHPDRPLDFKRVRLDSKEPFSVLRIPVDIELTSFEIESLIKALQKQNHEWIVGCRPVSIIKKDSQGVEQPQKTYIECLVPNFVVESHDPKAPPRVLSIPLPAIVDTYKAVENQCGVMTGMNTGRGLGFRKVPLLKTRGQVTRVEPLYAGAKDRKLPRELQFHAGIKGRVVDLFTRKVVEGATVTVVTRDNVYKPVSSAAGEYLIPELQLKGLNRRALGQHRKYNDGYGVIQKIVIDEVAPQGDLYLDPKRVTVTGKISETYRPKFGSGLKGIRVGFDGYPDFQATTDENGFYVIKNVPASLVDFSVTDPTGGHKPASRKLDLDPDRVNDQVDFTLEPNLTEIKGQVTSRGKPVEGLQVILPGFPEFVTVTDAQGRYEFRDIPQTASTVEVLSDPEVIYIGKSETIAGFKPYQKHTQNVVVKYNRSDITGRVYDVISKAPVAGVKVYVEGGEEKYSAVTDSYGVYKITKVPSSATTLLLKGVDKKFVWRPRKIDPELVPGEDRDRQDFRLVPRDYIQNNIVFILTWNERQPDLDSQLFLPDGRHLYFKTLKDNTFASNGGATLDKDDTSVAGRETTVVFMKDGKTQQPGTYRFLVFQYVNQNLSFQDADALVEVYKDGEFLQEIRPSQGRGRVWYVGMVENDQFRVIDQFPAGELYERLDELEKELKNNVNRPADEANALNSLIDRENALVGAYNLKAERINQRRADLELIRQGKEPVIPVVAPPAPPPPPPPPGAPPPTPAPPRVLTPVEKADLVSKELAQLQKELDATQSQLDKTRDQIAKKKAFIEQLPRWLESRSGEIEREKSEINRRIEQILSTYR